VLDSQGKIVRHLAAGVLGGKNPPPEPLKAGLSQMLEWDLKDDNGKTVPGGSFKVQVRAGMGAKFGKIFGTSPYTGMVTSGSTSANPSDSIALDADGTLYLKMGSFVPSRHDGIPWQLRKFDKAGKYQKTLLPYPPSTDPAKTPGFRLIDTGHGLLTPVHNSGLDVVLWHFGNNLYSKVVDGSVVFIDSGAAKLTFFKVDGSNTVKTVPMRSSPDKLKWADYLSPQLAFSPDGKYAYYSNVALTPYDGRKPSDIDPKFPQGRIYRQDVSKPGADPEKFYDLELPDWEKTKYWLPSAWDKKTAAAGITVDSKGNLFVCDLVNQEVVEVSPEGKKISAAKVPWPDKVLVNSKTGTLYVVSSQVSRGLRPPSELLKITGRGAEAKVAARLPLKGELGFTFAIDDSGEVPALWLGGGGEVVRVEDRGTELVAGKNFINSDKNAIEFVCYGDVDKEADLVYVATGCGPVWRYNGETGEGTLMPFKACDVAIGSHGMIYGWGETGSYDGPIARYSRDGKPAPLANGKNTYGHVFGRFGRGSNAPGMTVDNRGWVYAICGFNDCHMRVYNAEGNLVDYERKITVAWGNDKQEVPTFLSYVWDAGGSVRVDNAYNVYVLELGLPKGFAAPKGFAKDPAYSNCSGSIYKFTPKGGEFKKVGEAYEAVGAIQTYPACGPISCWWQATGGCHCMRPRFDVDGYGRLYMTHGVTYKVSVRDNANNEITSFGGYGNWDAQGPASKEPKPEIPLGWPIFAGASDKYIYVGDGLNHRVVRVDKKYDAEEMCDVK
jgi:hypothetical protein